MNQATGTGLTVTVMVRGQVLDCASLETAEAAEEYKRAVRAWAYERPVQVQIYCRDSAQQLAPTG